MEANVSVNEARLPIDPNLKLPPGVAAQAAAANAAHKAAYGGEEDEGDKKEVPTVGEENKQEDDPNVPTITDPQPGDPPEPPEAPRPLQPQRTPRAAPPDSGEPGSWEHRYHAMKGRFDQSQNTVGSLQQQLTELGDELMRTQHLLRTPSDERPQRPGQAPRKMVTNEDLNTYGPELIDLIQRAAVEAVAPQVHQVAQRVTQSAQQAMYNVLNREVPTWQEINTDPNFISWCNLPDVYSGQLRGNLLKAAYQAADAPRVIAFFKGFLAEEQATGQQPDLQAQPTPQPPRQAAVKMESLIAPGRQKPASGGSPANAADKPVFTRAEIANFYTAVRQGQFVGREQDKAKIEAQIFDAQRNQRIRG